MYDFKIEAADTAIMYRDLASALEGLVSAEPDGVANMANVAALIWETCRTSTGSAFTATSEGNSSSAHSRAAGVHPHQVRQGVCGAAAAARQVQRVEDVHAFPGHIACDAASASELVVPIIREGELVAVLDIDSPRRALHGRG